MEINVTSRSKVRKITIDLATRFLRKELKLEKSTFVLQIYTVPKLKKEDGFNGMISQTGPELTMILDSRLGEADLIQCVAHEMVHAKQIAKGQLTLDKRNNFGWVNVLTKFTMSVPEQEAFSRERLLASRALAFCEKEMGKQVKKMLKSLDK